MGRDRRVTWPLALLHLVADSARMGLRELDRLEALLRAPALTPKALAMRLKAAPQTGTALLRALQPAGLVRELTGRGSFCAFAI